MPGVFISYRREDSGGYTGRLFDILSAHFGRKNIYMDLDTIQGGDNFVAVIEEKIGVSDVLVAVIGTRWLTVTEANGTPRLDNPHDFVRLEIAKALERGIRVIPVLVDGATMPRSEDLPQDLRPLSERQAVDIRDSHFHADAQQLLQVLHKAIHGIGFRPEMNRKRLIPAVLAVIGIIAAVLALLMFRQPNLARREASNAVAGNWIATVKYDWGDTHQESFEFEIDGQEVSGTASFLGGRRGILDGRLEGNRISFTTKSLSTLNSDEKPYEEKHHYKGTVEGDGIRFTMMTESEIESHVPIHFTATKVKTN